MNRTIETTDNIRDKMKEIRIIQITKLNVSEFLKPLSALFDKYRQFYKQPPNPDQSRLFINERVENQDSVVFAAINNRSIVMGFAQLYPSFSSITTQNKWILNDLFVSRNYRRQGVAKLILRRVYQHSVETNAGSIFLETQKTNISAQALYESIGYVKEDEHQTYYIEVPRENH